nr:hypothetical protein [Tanacetum cinerariifolium]
MDGLARPGASKGVSKRSHFQYSCASWISEPGGQGTGKPSGQGTHGPVGLSTHESNGPCIHEPGGPSTRELGGLVINHEEEDDHEDAHKINDPHTETNTSDDELEENIGSTSHGKTITRKETRALGETRKSCLNKKNLAFERDIITKSVENSNYDETCDNMEQAMQKQLVSQHKNKQYKSHLHFKKYPTKEAVMMHPPDGVRTRDWVNLCDRFASEAFQKISAKNKKNRSFNKVPPAVGSLSVARRVYKKKKEGNK